MTIIDGGFSSTIVDTVSLSGHGYYRGVGWDGTNLLSMGGQPAYKIYKYSGFSNTVLDSFAHGFGAVWCQGLVWTDWAGAVPEIFTVTLQYKQAGGAYANVTSALGDVGADVQTGSKVAYWDDPGQDRANVEISDAQMQLTLVPDANNEGTHSVNVTSAAQLSAGDGTGAQGDVKVEYKIT